MTKSATHDIGRSVQIAGQRKGQVKEGPWGHMGEAAFPGVGEQSLESWKLCSSIMVPPATELAWCETDFPRLRCSEKGVLSGVGACWRGW